MILCTTESVPGRAISAVLGLVRGNTVRSGHFGEDMNAWLKNLVGGEIHEYTKLMAQAREEALDRMMEEARAQGADAVVGLRFEGCEIATGAAEFLAYGTAVRLAR
jgi:uncharacterized protein YbjQ (UPF0145 family)